MTPLPAFSTTSRSIFLSTRPAHLPASAPPQASTVSGGAVAASVEAKNSATLRTCSSHKPSCSARGAVISTMLAPWS